MASTLERLWSLADKLAAAAETKRTGVNVFDPVGLLLERPLERNTYEETPLNTLCFARTGGGGVHFSFLTDDGAVSDESPIVLTIPMDEDHNTIVGENLLEFLSLGCVDGYFRLEMLPGNRDELIENLMHGKRAEMHEYEHQLLKAIRDEFDVRPWPDIRTRLSELKQKYRSTLQFDEDAELE